MRPRRTASSRSRRTRRLRSPLDDESLAARFRGSLNSSGKTRTIAMAWRPRGTAETPTEIAVVWSEHSDAAYLEKAFEGPNALKHETVCKQDVFASSPAI